MTQGNIPAGWHDDGQGAQRWWDGSQWTDHTRPAPSGGPPRPQQGDGQHPQEGYGQQPQQGYGQQPPYPSQSGGKGKLIALIGGGVALVLVIGVVLLVVLSGGGSPKDAADDFASAIADNDCDAIEIFSNSYLDTDADGRDDAVETAKKDCNNDEGDFAGDATGAGCDVETSNEEVDGDEATVDLAATGCDDDAENFEGTLGLVKEDGDWRVDSLR